MLYIYAGLGMAMLLPIMAGLQLTVFMAEAEGGNDVLLRERLSKGLRDKDGNPGLVAVESEFMQKALDDLRVEASTPGLFSDACPSALGQFSEDSDPEVSGQCIYVLNPVDAELDKIGSGRFLVKHEGGDLEKIRGCFVDYESARQKCPFEGQG